jgi:hypothetical protein
MSERPGAGSLTVRPSTAGDRAALARLAQLDSAPPPVGDYLLALEGGELRAAVPMGPGRALADPFYPTRHLLAILALRLGMLHSLAGEGRGQPVRSGELRPSPRPGRAQVAVP